MNESLNQEHDEDLAEASQLEVVDNDEAITQTDHDSPVKDGEYSENYVRERGRKEISTDRYSLRSKAPMLF